MAGIMEKHVVDKFGSSHGCKYITMPFFPIPCPQIPEGQVVFWLSVSDTKILLCRIQCSPVKSDPEGMPQTWSMNAKPAPDMMMDLMVLAMIYPMSVQSIQDVQCTIRLHQCGMREEIEWLRYDDRNGECADTTTVLGHAYRVLLIPATTEQANKYDERMDTGEGMGDISTRMQKAFCFSCGKLKA